MSSFYMHIERPPTSDDFGEAWKKVLGKIGRRLYTGDHQVRHQYLAKVRCSQGLDPSGLYIRSGVLGLPPLDLSGSGLSIRKIRVTNE
jgi:hypothetical protein